MRISDWSSDVCSSDLWRIELSLAFAVVLLIFSFVLLYWIVRVLSWTSSSPERFRSWRGRRAQKRDLDLLESGWINVLEGRYVQAEKELSSLLTKTRSPRSEEHTSELQSLMRISYAVFCSKKK